MIGTVLKELQASAIAQLPNKIGLISQIRATELGGNVLNDSFDTYSWWKTEAEALKINFPALSFTWADTRTGQRNGIQARKGKHRVVVSYGFRSGDMAEIERHILFVPEAIVLWLDELPTASRPTGSGLTIIGLERANEEEIEISHGLESAKGGVFIWSVDVAFTVLAQDSGLPDRGAVP